jgi:hypothetical protein
MATFKVRNVNDARVVAEYFRVETPEGRGKFPIKALERALAEQGHTLDTTDYVTSDALPRDGRVFEVKALVRRGDVIVPETATVSIDRVRQATGNYARGRVSKSDIVNVVIKDMEWDVHDTRSIVIS